MKPPEFGGVPKIGKYSFHVLRISCIIHEFKYPPKFLGCLMGHRWRAPTLLRKKRIDFEIKLDMFWD
jgi:hypothetical protein